MKITTASRNDLQQLAEVHIRSWQQAYQGLVPQQVLDNLDPVQRAASWEKRLGSTDSHILTARDDQGITGFIHTSRCRDVDLNPQSTSEITSIYLHPDYFRQGIGTLLLNSAVDSLRQAGYQQVSLWVLSRNSNARAFYHKHHFATDGQVKHLTRLQADEVRYIRSIN
ncbi:GNAT family N-acetyltransferase [Spongorhabdus nitratireducens]